MSHYQMSTREKRLRRVAREEIIDAANERRREIWGTSYDSSMDLTMRHIQRAVCIVRSRVSVKTLEQAGFRPRSRRR